MFEHEGNVTLYRFWPDKGEAQGFFLEERPDTIYINEKCSVYEREMTYWHEDAHRQCFKNKCFCWAKSTDFWAEYHAFKYELLKVINHDSVDLQRAYLAAVTRALEKYESNPKEYPHHKAALLKVMRTKRFKIFAEILQKSPNI